MMHVRNSVSDLEDIQCIRGVILSALGGYHDTCGRIS